MRYPIDWMNNLPKYFRCKWSKMSENSHGTLISIDSVICVGHLANLVTIFMPLLMDTWYLFSNRMLQLVRTQITFGSIVLFLRWILSKSVRFLLEAIFLKKFELRARRSKGLSSKPTLYCQNNAFYIAWQTYTGMHRYIDSPLFKTWPGLALPPHRPVLIPLVSSEFLTGLQNLTLLQIWSLKPQSFYQMDIYCLFLIGFYKYIFLNWHHSNLSTIWLMLVIYK